jgi:hypothetical protein
LTCGDLELCCKGVTALGETIRLMPEIDADMPKLPMEWRVVRAGGKEQQFCRFNEQQAA